MSYLCLAIICMLSSLSLCAYEAQTYSPDHYPKIKKISQSKILLNDGSEWEAVPDLEESRPVLIRWDDAKKKYFFQDMSAKNSQKRIYVEMKRAPDLTIQSMQGERLRLSNGMSFEFLPFKGDVHVNGRVLLSLNENPKGNEFPYFIVEYKENPGNAAEPWEFVGEVQARLSKD